HPNFAVGCFCQRDYWRRSGSQSLNVVFRDTECALCVRSQYSVVAIFLKIGDYAWTVSDALKLAIFLAYEIGTLWKEPQFSASIRKQLQYGNIRSGGDGSKRDRPEIKAVETYQASVGSNPEESIYGLRDAVDRAAGKPGFGGPLFADVLRRQMIRIECTCIGDKAR